MTMPSTSDIIDRCQIIFDDLHFGAARAWKQAASGRFVVGYMPFYVPRELIQNKNFRQSTSSIAPPGIKLASPRHEQKITEPLEHEPVEIRVRTPPELAVGVLKPKLEDVLRRDDRPIHLPSRRQASCAATPRAQT